MFQDLTNVPVIYYWIIGIWSVFWKALALWVTAKKNKPYWFIAILVLNTIGILPLVYLLYFEKKFLKEFFGKVRKRSK